VKHAEMIRRRNRRHAARQPGAGNFSWARRRSKCSPSGTRNK
jgi:hypothetical protein